MGNDCKCAGTNECIRAIDGDGPFALFSFPTSLPPSFDVSLVGVFN